MSRVDPELEDIREFSFGEHRTLGNLHRFLIRLGYQLQSNMQAIVYADGCDTPAILLHRAEILFPHQFKNFKLQKKGYMSIVARKCCVCDIPGRVALRLKGAESMDCEKCLVEKSIKELDLDLWAHSIIELKRKRLANKV